MLTIQKSIVLHPVKNWNLVRMDRNGDKREVLRAFADLSRANQEAMMLNRRFQHFQYTVEPLTPIQ